MIESVVAYTNAATGDAAGIQLGTEIATHFAGQSPDALILFASSKYDYNPLLQAIDQSCHPKIMVGCSSAGEFIHNAEGEEAQGEGAACAIALRSTEIRFAAGLGQQLRADQSAAAQQIITAFGDLSSHNYLFRSALVLTDALAGYADGLIEQLNLLTAGTYKLFGGGAGDDANFNRTHVFYGTQAYEDAAVALEILSNKPVGLGVQHGWEPASPSMRVTEVDGMRLISLNAVPVLEIFEDFAAETQQRFDVDDPIPFFLHNVIGIETGNGYKLRVPLAVNPDGSVACAADIPVGSTVCIMSATHHSAAQAASVAVESALQQLNGHKPKVALFFDCVATRLRMGQDFGQEMQALRKSLGTTPYAGCNTYGQIARAEGQFSGFHNCTAAVCIISD